MYHLQLYHHVLYRSARWTYAALSTSLVGMDHIDLANATQIAHYHANVLRKNVQARAAYEALFATG